MIVDDDSNYDTARVYPRFGSNKETVMMISRKRLKRAIPKTAPP